MNTKSKSVYRIDDVQIYLLPVDPPRWIVQAKGTANRPPRNARLCVSHEPSAGTVLLLDFVAEHGAPEVMTPVTATAMFDLGGFETVTVRGRENEISKPVPRILREAAAGSPSGGFEQREWRVRHFLRNKAIEPILPGTVLTAFFSANISGTVRGSGGCNAYGASFVWMPVGSINIHDLAHTDRYCERPEGIMQQESRFFDLLLQATEIEHRRELLELRGEDATGTFGIVFELAKP